MNVKWQSTYKTALVKIMAYRAGFVVTVISPSLVFFFVKYQLWRTIYERNLHEGGRVAGYAFGEMISYQVWILVVLLTSQSFNATQISEDIRFGRISVNLLHPFSFWKYHFCHFLAHQTVQSVVALLLISVALALGVGALGWHTCVGLFIAGLVSVLWFCITYFLGLAAFWLEETWVLRVMVISLSQFFSGAFFPTALFPEWLQSLIRMTPFPHMGDTPARILMGDPGALAASANSIISLTFWIFAMAFVCWKTWTNGLRLYSASGI